MDGVLADMDGTLARLAEQEFGVTSKSPAPARAEPDAEAAAPAAEAPPPYDTALLNSLTPRQQSRLWQRVRDTRISGEARRVRARVGAPHPATGARSPVGRPVRHAAARHRRPHAAAADAALVEAARVRVSVGLHHDRIARADAAALTLDAHVDDRLENCIEVATQSKAWPSSCGATPSRSSASARAPAGWASPSSAPWARRSTGRGGRPVPAQAEQPSLLDRLKKAFRG